MIVVFYSEEPLGPDGMPWVTLWRPEALDCRAPFPPETWNGFTRNLPSVRFDLRTSYI